MVKKGGKKSKKLVSKDLGDHGLSPSAGGTSSQHTSISQSVDLVSHIGESSLSGLGGMVDQQRQYSSPPPTTRLPPHPDGRSGSDGTARGRQPVEVVTGTQPEHVDRRSLMGGSRRRPSG